MTVVGLVGVTGLAGAGKTTAVGYFSDLTSGRILYLGETVLSEVRARGLPQTPQNERDVRMDLRRKKGQAALALPFVDIVAECVASRIPVFVDAIYTKEEFNTLRSPCSKRGAHLLAIDASFRVRSTRLAARQERPYSCAELRERDKIELERLGTSAVMAAADHTISNEQSLDEFHRKLSAFLHLCP